jgi:Prokaryotic membrane lipoprotein lipid attachment site
MRKSLVILGAAALVAGCQTTARYQGDESSPFYVVPSGSRVVLNRELTVPPEQTRVYIQNGRVVQMTEVQHYYPYCRLEVYNRRDTAQTVAPDEATVTRAVQEEIQGAFVDAGPLMLAGRLIRVQGGESQGGPIIQSFSTRMELRSPKQPDLFRLTCAQLGYPGQDRHVTISEIRRTLDPLVTLRLPNESAS